MIIVVWFIVWIVLDLLRQLQVETFEFDFNVLFIFPNNNIIFFYYELTGVLCTYSYVGYLIIRNLTNDFRLVFSFLVNLSSRQASLIGKYIIGLVISLVFSFASYYTINAIVKTSDQWAKEYLPIYHGVWTFFNLIAGDTSIRNFCVNFITSILQESYKQCCRGGTFEYIPLKLVISYIAVS